MSIILNGRTTIPKLVREMAYAIFEANKEKMNDANTVINDDIVSRQSIVIREASALGVDKDIQIILIEGADEAVARAKDMFKDKDIKESTEADVFYKKIKEQESNAASGMGMIFG